MTKALASATTNYKKLEDQHFKNVNIMKEAEERARTEVAKREKIEGEMAEMKEKMKKLESECILSIGKA
jgi:precorrin isomerase